MTPYAHTHTHTHKYTHTLARIQTQAEKAEKAASHLSSQSVRNRPFNQASSQSVYGATKEIKVSLTARHKGFTVFSHSMTYVNTSLAG